jgi:hypothetical protein
MTPTITAFERSPDRGKGQARDMRVRWALEEVGQPYDVRLVSFSEMKEPAHCALHPFRQIPTYEEGDLAPFESAAIVFHIAERHGGLLPDDAHARERSPRMSTPDSDDRPARMFSSSAAPTNTARRRNSPRRKRAATSPSTASVSISFSATSIVDFIYRSTCVYRKPKPERSGDEVRPKERVNLSSLATPPTDMARQFSK